MSTYSSCFETERLALDLFIYFFTDLFTDFFVDFFVDFG